MGLTKLFRRLPTFIGQFLFGIPGSNTVMANDAAFAHSEEFIMVGAFCRGCAGEVVPLWRWGIIRMMPPSMQALKVLVHAPPIVCYTSCS